MRKISCQERDEIFQGKEMDVVSSVNGLDGYYSGKPYVETVWGWGDLWILKDIRHPGEVGVIEDRLPCEHYLLEGGV